MHVALPIDNPQSKQRLRVVQPSSAAEYHKLGAFIKEVYWRRYEAVEPHLLPILVALEDENQSLIAACGLSLGSQHPLFLEHYLDLPAEQSIAKYSDVQHIRRDRIVEVGNLSAAIPSGGRLMIGALCQWFYQQGLDWVVFTGTTQLRNSFQRLGIGLTTLAVANPQRLGDQGQRWGCYYQAQPKVMAGNIRTNYMQLSRVVERTDKNIFPLHLEVIASHETD